MKFMNYLQKKYGYGADLNMAGVGNIFKISDNKRSFAVKTLIASIIVMVLLLFSLFTPSSDAIMDIILLAFFFAVAVGSIIRIFRESSE